MKLRKFLNLCNRHTRYSKYREKRYFPYPIVLHHLKNTIVIALTILILIGCQSKTKKELIIDEKPIVNENRTETKFFGDSLKVISEYRGDTIIQKRIDLKGTSDDNFDSSFTTTSVWSTRATSILKCADEIMLTVDVINFKFSYEDIFNKIDENIEKVAILEGPCHPFRSNGATLKDRTMIRFFS